MTLSFNNTSLTLILFSFVITSSFAQTYKDSTIELLPIEHASLIINALDKSIAIDPVGSNKVSKKSIDFILITDIHGDHFDQSALEQLITPASKIIAPKAVFEQMNLRLQTLTTVLENGEVFQDKSIKIEAIPMYNLREEAKNFHRKGRGNGYVLSLNNERIYISGDTEDIPEMRSLKDIDVALICMNLPYTMTESSAASAVMEFKPKKVIPYHYRGRPNVSNLDLFEELITDPSIEVIRLDWYPKMEY